MKSRIYTALIIVGIFVVGHVFVRLLQSNANITNNTQFRSFEERRMPCGRILQRTVEEKDGVWTKTVRLLDPSGKELNSKTATIEPETCNRIRSGVFVPRLWGADGAMGCVRN